MVLLKIFSLRLSLLLLEALQVLFGKFLPPFISKYKDTLFGFLWEGLLLIKTWQNVGRTDGAMFKKIISVNDLNEEIVPVW